MNLTLFILQPLSSAPQLYTSLEHRCIFRSRRSEQLKTRRENEADVTLDDQVEIFGMPSVTIGFFVDCGPRFSF